MGGALKARYQIEDLVDQDDTGAVYCARDTETDRLVAVRRFFPMGISGGGFVEDEKEGFGKTVEALQWVRHEALRGVVDGAVDEIDGMPYLVMDWVEGTSLSKILENGPLKPEQAIVLAGKGLELLSLLGGKFGEGSDWIEMEPDTVVVTADDGRFTFWICPFQWLGVADRDGGIRGLGHLVEHAMGWSDRLVPAAAAAGLGGWVDGAKKLGWTIEEAERELGKVRSFWTGEVVEEVLPPEAGQNLADPGGPVAAAPVPAGPARPVSLMPVVRRPSRGSLWMAASVAAVLLVLTGLVWGVIAMRDGRKAKLVVKQEEPPGRVVTIDPKVVPPDDGLTAQERINLQFKKATEAMERGDDQPGDGDNAAEDVEGGDSGVEMPGPGRSGPYGPDDGAALRKMVGATQQLQARLFRVRDSNSGKTRYLEFSDKTGRDDVCCRFWARDREGMRLEDLKKLEGKMLRFMGLVQKERGTGRILLHLDHPGQIEVIE